MSKDYLFFFFSFFGFCLKNVLIGLLFRLASNSSYIFVLPPLQKVSHQEHGNPFVIKQKTSWVKTKLKKIKINRGHENETTSALVIRLLTLHRNGPDLPLVLYEPIKHKKKRNQLIALPNFFTVRNQNPRN